MNIEFAQRDEIDLVRRRADLVELRQFGVELSRQQVRDPFEVADLQEEFFQSVAGARPEPAVVRLPFEFAFRTVRTDVLVVGFDGRLGGQRRVLALAGAVPAGPDLFRPELIAVQHRLQLFAARPGGLFGDSDARGPARHLDELLGAARHVVVAVLDPKPTGTGTGARFLQIEPPAEQSLAVTTDDDRILVAGFVQEQRTHVGDLFRHVRR